MFHLKVKLKRFFTFLLFVSSLIFFLIIMHNSPPYFRSSFYAPSSPLYGMSNYPGTFIKYVHAKPNNVSYCQFNYDLPTSLKFGISDLGFGPELQESSSYRILHNVVESEMKMDIPAVTYATHVTADFVNYIPELARFWDGYISVAAFVTDYDFLTTLSQINHLCLCLPQMSRVSIHLVFNQKTTIFNGNKLNLPQPKHCIIKDITLPSTNRNFYLKQMYPVNVCRNVARTASQTEHVLVSDVQLIPSLDLAQKFVKMLSKWGNRMKSIRSVFVLPIFEVERDEDIPRTKERLIKLIREERAVYFHRLVCMHCQKFPGLENWFQSDPQDTIQPFIIAKREVPFHRWEPIYIGTKNEPYYNEELSWEGLQDKMPQMLEMCLIGYKFVILDGAFLVHWPGIKKTKGRDKEVWRIPFEKENNRQYHNILKKLSEKYPNNQRCKVQ